MKPSKHFIPEGFHNLTPTIVTRDAAKAIEFYKKAFGAEEIDRAMAPDGKRIIHAVIRIGNSNLMLSDEFPEWGTFAPEQSNKGTPMSIWLYVKDVDTTLKQATEAGAKTLMPTADMFWGDRFGKIQDPFGHQWSIATRKFDMTAQEQHEGQEKFFKATGGKKN